MNNANKPPCPNCGRPMSLEYNVEVGACQMWRQVEDAISIVGGKLYLSTKPDHYAAADCFFHTRKRVRELTAKVVELAEAKQAAQRALRRHYDALQPLPIAKCKTDVVVPDMFHDDARIEVG